MTGEQRRDVAEKLEAAGGYFRDAERQRDMIAGSLAEDDLPDPYRLHLETELHVADHRVNLWRDVVRELRKRQAGA